MDFLVDDNPKKQGLFSPGYHLPVLPSDAIYERRPDYLLIAAWMYGQPIMDRHPAYLKQGGHFILPLPELKIV